MWLKWLDTREADCARVFAFDFSKAFDSANHFILFNKFRELSINPYIGLLLFFLFSSQQRVIADGNMIPFLPTNRDIHQGTILGPILFSLMLNDIQAVESDRSTMVKFADDSRVLIKETHDQTLQEVENIPSWTQNNILTINLTKTNEMIVKGDVERPLLTVTFDIKQEVFLKILGVYFYSNPKDWEKQIDALLSKAGRRMHILRVCKKNGYSLDS